MNIPRKNRRNPIANALAIVFAPLRALVVGYRRWHQSQILYTSLNQLDRHLLRDIGISRDQIALVADGRLRRMPRPDISEDPTVPNITERRRRQIEAVRAACRAQLAA